MEKLEKLAGSLDRSQVKRNEILAPYTTLKIGGPADILFEAKSVSELIQAVELARSLEVPHTILWGGSNVLISDTGIRGLVIRNSAKTIRVSSEILSETPSNSSVQIDHRWQPDTKTGTFKYAFEDLNYDESDCPKAVVTIESGADLLFAANRLLNEGITGFQWYAGIPGTIGGAIFNNIHGGSHFIHETLFSVRILSADGGVREIFMEDGAFGYDQSRFHGTDEVLLDATFHLPRGDVTKARYVFGEWAKRKAIQPRNSPGCAFANISHETMDRCGYPTTSVGYIVEHVLKMGGFRIGNAGVSRAHHNFIVNEWGATAKEYLAVLTEIAKRAQEELKIRLIPEIFFLGFSEDEIVAARMNRGNEYTNANLYSL